MTHRPYIPEFEPEEQGRTIVYFDCGGVLGASAGECMFASLHRKEPNLQREDFRNILLDERVLTGPMGTLAAVLRERPALALTTEDFLEAFVALPQYTENLQLAQRLKSLQYIVGIISDQFAESAAHLRHDAVVAAASVLLAGIQGRPGIRQS